MEYSVGFPFAQACGCATTCSFKPGTRSGCESLCRRLAEEKPRQPEVKPLPNVVNFRDGRSVTSPEIDLSNPARFGGHRN